MVICLERGADLHIAQLMPLPLTVSRFSKIQIGFTFLVPAHLGSPGKRAVKRALCVTGALYHAGICGGCRQPSQESPCQACGLSHRAQHSCDINDKCHNNSHCCFIPRRYLCWRMSSTESAKPMSSMRSTSSSTTCRSCRRSRVPRSRKSMIRPGVPTTTSTPARTLASVCCVHAVQHTYQRKLGLLN